MGIGIGIETPFKLCRDVVVVVDCGATSALLLL